MDDLMPEQHKMSLDIWIGVLLVLAAIAVGYILFSNRDSSTAAEDQRVAVFTCNAAKSITATFYPEDDHVQLDLSDGRELSLPRAMSASGARYANDSESFVFWNKGNTAFITENGSTTYENCATER